MMAFRDSNLWAITPNRGETPDPIHVAEVTAALRRNEYRFSYYISVELADIAYADVVIAV